MEQFRVGDFVTIPLKTRNKIGLVIEIDDCDGEYKDNPWVVIKTLKGSFHATARNSISRGVKKIPYANNNPVFDCVAYFMSSH